MISLEMGVTSLTWPDSSRHFNSYQWNFPDSVDSSVIYFTNVIVSAMHKFIPLCVPRLS